MSTILKNYIMAKKRKAVEPVLEAPVAAGNQTLREASPPMPRWFWICLAAMVLVTVGIYVQTGRHDWVNLDDIDYIPGNTNVRAGLTLAGIRWAFTAVSYFYWQPLTWVSHMVDCQLFGLNPGGHHLMSMAIHAGNSALLAWALFLLTGSAGRSAFAAALFCVHPLRVESVAWAAERKDVLSGLFWILTIAAYARYCKGPTTKRYVLLCAAAAAASMSKPTVVTLPFVLLLLDWWPLRRLDSIASLRPRLMEKIPLFAMTVFLSVITYVGQKAAGASVSVESMPVYYRVLNALNSYGGYLRKTVWPTNLSILYPMHKLDTVDLWVAFAAMAGITAVCLRYAKEYRYGIVGWLWFVGALVPMIGLAQAGVQSMADRFTYIPSMGLFVAAAWLLADVSGRVGVPARAQAAVACALCAMLATASYRYTGYWKDSFTLFEHSTAVTEDNDFLHINLANLYFNKGRYEEAAKHFEEAVRIEPKVPALRLQTAQNYMRSRQPEKALPHLRALRELTPQDPGPRQALAEALWQTGRQDEARAEADELLRIAPNDIEAKALRMMMR